MDERQKMLLSALKKKFGYQLATEKDAAQNLKDDELLGSLLILDLDIKITYALADFIDKWGNPDHKEPHLAIANVFIRHIEQAIGVATKLDPAFGQFMKQQIKKKFEGDLT